MMSQESNTTPEGWVYLIVDDRDEGCVKIGFTTRDPIHRAYELISTGTRGTFVVIYQAWVRNPARVEEAVHRRLAARNLSGEWFEVCPNLAKREITTAAGGVQFEKCVPRWHPSQREPRPWTRTVLEEARLAAEEEARRQQEAEEEARRLAEEERIRKAKAEEEACKQAELAEHQKRAEEAAREAERKRREAFAAHQRREWWRRASRVAAKMAGLAALLGLAIFAIAGPHSKADVVRRRSRLEAAEGRAAEINASLRRVRKDIQQELEEASRLASVIERLTGEVAWYEGVVRTQTLNMRYAKYRLENFRKSPPSGSSKALRSESELLTAAVKSHTESLADAEAALENTRKRLKSAEFAASPSGGRVKVLKSSEASLEQSRLEHSPVVDSARRALDEATRHNDRWSW